MAYIQRGEATDIRHRDVMYNVSLIGSHRSVRVCCNEQIFLVDGISF